MLLGLSPTFCFAWENWELGKWLLRVRLPFMASWHRTWTSVCCVMSYWTWNAKDWRTRAALHWFQLINENDRWPPWNVIKCAFRCCLWIATSLLCIFYVSSIGSYRDGLEIIPIIPLSYQFLFPASPNLFVLLSGLMSCIQTRIVNSVTDPEKEKCLLPPRMKYSRE